jgi:hypothetical protein
LKTNTQTYIVGGTVYKKGKNGIILIGYVDTDWRGAEDRKSTIDTSFSSTICQSFGPAKSSKQSLSPPQKQNMWP